MDSLIDKPRRDALQRALRNFPDSTSGAFEDAITRIKAQKPDDERLAFTVLGLIVCARRILSLGELQQALMVMSFDDEEYHPATDLLNSDNQIEAKTILGATSGLVITRSMVAT